MKKVSCKDTCCHLCVRTAKECAELEHSLGRCNKGFGSRGCKEDKLSGAECPEFKEKV